MLDSHGKKVHEKYWKKSDWRKRGIYCPQGVSQKDAEVLAHFRKWAWRFDMWFYHCTCGMTIGLGAILGLIPMYVGLRNQRRLYTERLTAFSTSIGDFADLIVGLLLIEHIKKRVTLSHKGEALDEGQTKRFVRVLNKMRMSVLLAAGIGIIPLFGDVFDAVYKANTRNVWLLEQFMKDEALRTALAMDKTSTQLAKPTQS